jgi:hypothetical protein
MATDRSASGSEQNMATKKIFALPVIAWVFLQAPNAFGQQLEPTSCVDYEGMKDAAALSGDPRQYSKDAADGSKHTKPKGDCGEVTDRDALCF